MWGNEQLDQCTTDVSVWNPLPPNHPVKGNFMIFQNKILLGGGNSAAHKVQLPLWLHLHILPESSNTTEFISYFTEPSRRTLPCPPCQPQVWPKKGESNCIKRPSYSIVLRAWVNFSPGLTFTAPHTAATAAARFACQHCSHLSLC